MHELIGRIILFFVSFLPVWVLLKLESIFARSTGKGQKENLSSEVALCLGLLQGEPNIFLDVGANKGEYTLEVLKHYPDLKSYLFEPSPENIEVLERSFPENDVNVFGIALSNFNGVSNLFSDFPGSGTASLTKREIPSSDVTFDLLTKVEVSTVEEFWNKNINYDYIDLLKIDVEGHELDVLEGCGEKIKSIKVIQFEFGGTHIDTRVFFRDFWNFFESNDFCLYRIADKKCIEIKSYSLDLEVFQTTNYIAMNRTPT
tara:strand:- start:350 stop:1126 length:777 start_codon:yes stop_codon:yes gene_type:complete